MVRGVNLAGCRVGCPGPRSSVSSVGHLKDVLNKAKVGPKDQEEVFAIILGLRPQIVDRPDETRLSRDAVAQR